MKGAIAAFVAAAAATPVEAGTISLIITGDEEGPAIFGTRALIEHMSARGVKPDLLLVGEPTSVDRLGQQVKLGRRGAGHTWKIRRASRRAGGSSYRQIVGGPGYITKKTRT